MKVINNIRYVILTLLGGIVSCTSEEVILEKEEINNITIIAEDFKYNSQSRSDFDITEKGAIFKWSKDDKIGVFPTEGAQADFHITNGEGSLRATFNGGGWALKPSSKYMAYYPLIEEFKLDKTAIPVNFERQIQVGNASSAHLGNYDFMAASAVTPEKGNVKFHFKHLCALVELNISVPNKGDLTSVTLSSEEAIFTTNGTIDLTSVTPMITSVNQSKSIKVELKENTTSANKEIAKVYLMMAPSDLTGKNITATIINNGVEHKGTLETKNLEAGSAYKLSVTLKEQKPVQNAYHVAKAGTLSQLIGEENKFKITELKLTGELNGTDIRFLREMAGRDVYGNPTNGILSSLDIFNTKIVEGGDCYYHYKQDYLTVNNAINNYTFHQCSSLFSVILPKNVTTIDREAFSYSGLTNIVIPNSVTTIGDMAFFMTNLTSIIIPNSVTTIGVDAFNYCNELTSIIIPNSVTTIGNGAFYSCNKLTSITIPNSVSTIGDWTFSLCSRLTSITIPNSVTTIGNNAFSNCSGLTSIVIPNSVTTIGESTFSGCSGLTIIKIENGMKILGDSFLLSADNCKKLYLPSTLKQIRSQALPPYASAIYCFADEAPTLYPNNGLSESCKIYVPKGSVEKYKAADGWKDHAANIFEMPEGVTEP